MVSGFIINIDVKEKNIFIFLPTTLFVVPTAIQFLYIHQKSLLEQTQF